MPERLGDHPDIGTQVDAVLPVGVSEFVGREPYPEVVGPAWAEREVSRSWKALSKDGPISP